MIFATCCAYSDIGWVLTQQLAHQQNQCWVKTHSRQAKVLKLIYIIIIIWACEGLVLNVGWVKTHSRQVKR